MLDLWEANRRQLLGAGVRGEKISWWGSARVVRWMKQGGRYFSHRGERGYRADDECGGGGEVVLTRRRRLARLAIRLTAF